mmetsp:Transcript_23775/g.61022  ORF Transcript_23775/g.61022 Transcript_23775/m.61022 type:complete len:97 (-) Transcript_23775:200-490(-)
MEMGLASWSQESTETALVISLLAVMVAYVVGVLKRTADAGIFLTDEPTDVEPISLEAVPEYGEGDEQEQERDTDGGEAEDDEGKLEDSDDDYFKVD